MSVVFVSFLQYFFSFATTRVKELVPGGPSEGKTPDDVPAAAFSVDGTSPQNSDLALIKTSNVSWQYTVWNLCNFVS